MISIIPSASRARVREVVAHAMVIVKTKNKKKLQRAPPPPSPVLFSHADLFRGDVLPLVELVQEKVLNALRSPAAHGTTPQVAAQSGELAAQRDNLELEHEPAPAARDGMGWDGWGGMGGGITMARG